MNSDSNQKDHERNYEKKKQNQNQNSNSSKTDVFDRPKFCLCTHAKPGCIESHVHLISNKCGCSKK